MEASVRRGRDASTWGLVLWATATWRCIRMFGSSCFRPGLVFPGVVFACLFAR